MPSIDRPVQAGARGRGRPPAECAPNPEQLTRIALSAFAARGYEGASLRTIAARAGVDPALLSRRYGSKMGLWKATVDHLGERMNAFQQTVTELQPGPSGIPAAERLRRAVRAFVRFNCEVPELGRFFTDEIGHPGERRSYLMERIWHPHAAFLRTLLGEARRNARAPAQAVDPDMLLLVLTGMVSMPLMMRSVAEEECRIASDTLPERLARTLESLLLPDEPIPRDPAAPDGETAL